MKVLNLFSQRSFHLIHLLLFLCHEVAANTEIINFSSSREPVVDLPLDVVGNWTKLHPTDNERRWSLEPAALHTPLHQVCEQTADTVASHRPFSCPHELWLFLDLDDDKWASYSTFTLRLSWPASTPADFTIALYSSQDLFARLSERALISSSSSTPEPARTRAHAGASSHAYTSSTPPPHTHTTRARYARIRAVAAGVPTPGSCSHPQPRVPRLAVPHTASDAQAHVAADQWGNEATVPLVVILEPTHLGVLPASLLPTVGFLVPIVLAAVAFVPWVTAYLDPFVRQAREDLKTGMTRARKER